MSGTALALARAGENLYYLVDNAAVEGPPLWVHEGAIEKCIIAPLGPHRSERAPVTPLVRARDARPRRGLSHYLAQRFGEDLGRLIRVARLLEGR